MLKKIKDQALLENIRVTQHGQQEMAEEDISFSDLLEAIGVSEVLEDYEEHQRGPCCLLNGQNKKGDDLHIVCTTSLPVLVVITVYRPKPPKWITSRRRREKK